MSDNRSGGLNNTIARMMFHHLSSMEFCKPGKIVKFDAENNLADVKPVVKEKTTVDGQPEYRELPVILRMPVVLPYSPAAGLCFTQPIKEGDPCMMLFADRMLDNFIKEFAKGGPCVLPECCGGDNKTSVPRIHHLTDGICVPGLHGIKDKIPKWNNEAIELRNKERTCYFSMNKNCDITMVTTGNIVVKNDGDFTVNTKGKVNINGADDVCINMSSGNSAFSVDSNGSCCCSGTCSPTATDTCCTISTTGSMSPKSSCPAGTSNNCMTADGLGSLRLKG